MCRLSRWGAQRAACGLFCRCDKESTPAHWICCSRAHTYCLYSRVSTCVDVELCCVVILCLLAIQGTMSHMAPEALLRGHISKAADVYSFGITLWELFTGCHAYHGERCGC